MLEFEIEGFSELQKKIHDMSSSDDEDEGYHTEQPDDMEDLSINDLFHREFMWRHTDFDSLDAFFENSEWTVLHKDDFDEIPEDELDAYVDDNSNFSTWQSMLTQAINEYKQIR